MTDDDIVRLARAAALPYASGPWEEGWLPRYKEFAFLVAAAEREACAKVCETHTVDDVLVGVGIAQSCAAAIRARSKE